MKTAEEKAKEFLDWMLDDTVREYDDLVKSMTNLLKEQDSDTRKACAVAVSEVELNGSYYNAQQEMRDGCVVACLKIKAV